jgi:serine/threonine protein phosphatase PrpC
MTDEMRVSYGFPLRVSVCTDVGRIRTNNEDSHGYAWLADGSLFVIVADGMGGHEAGEVASGLAVQVLEEVVSRDLEADPRERLYHGLLEANEAILQEGRASGTRGMGTTAVALLCRGAEVHVGLVGDSRLYHIRRGQLVWRTLDHTRVQMLIDQGQVPEVEARSHPESGMLTRALGHSKMADGRPLVPDVLADPVRIDRDDALVLCSDGLHDLVEDWEIGQIVAGKAPATAAADLVRTAVERGGHDNITVAVITAGERTSPCVEPGQASSSGGSAAPAAPKPAPPPGPLRAPPMVPGPPRTEFTPGAFAVTPPPPAAEPEGFVMPRLPPAPPAPAPAVPVATPPPAPALPVQSLAVQDVPPAPATYSSQPTVQEFLLPGPSETRPHEPPGGVGPMDAPMISGRAPPIAAIDPLPLDLKPLPARAAVPDGGSDLASQSTVVRKPAVSVERLSAPAPFSEPAPLAPGSMGPGGMSSGSIPLTPLSQAPGGIAPTESGSITRRPSGGGLIFGLAAVTVVGIVAAGLVTVILVVLLVWAVLSL